MASIPIGLASPRAASAPCRSRPGPSHHGSHLPCSPPEPIGDAISRGRTPTRHAAGNPHSLGLRIPLQSASAEDAPVKNDPLPRTSVDRSFGQRLGSVVPEIRRWVARRRGVARLGRESVDDVVQSVCREARMARERGSEPRSHRALLRTHTRRKLDDRVRHWSAGRRDAAEAEDGLVDVASPLPSALEVAQGSRRPSPWGLRFAPGRPATSPRIAVGRATGHGHDRGAHGEDSGRRADPAMPGSRGGRPSAAGLTGCQRRRRGARAGAPSATAGWRAPPWGRGPMLSTP